MSTTANNWLGCLYGAFVVRLDTLDMRRDRWVVKDGTDMGVNIWFEDFLTICGKASTDWRAEFNVLGAY